MEVAGAFLSLPFLLAGGASARDWIDIITFRELRESLEDGRYARLKHDYGIVRTLLLLWAFPDGLDVIHRIEQDVLREKPEGAMRTRDALCAKYNMTAVAAAIIAQVAITALSLNQIDRTHWTVQAAFIVSLVTGCLSVFYCCMIQHSFGTLISAEDVKDWLCKPGRWHGIENELNTLEQQLRNIEPGSEAELSKNEMRALRSSILAGLHHDRWQTPSLNAAIMLVAPVRLLYYSVLLFLSGLGIYLILLVSKKINISSGANASVGVLIFFIVTVAFGILLFYVPTGLKSLEQLPRQRVRRGAEYIKDMLLAYTSLEGLEGILRQIRIAKACAQDELAPSPQNAAVEQEPPQHRESDASALPLHSTGDEPGPGQRHLIIQARLLIRKILDTMASLDRSSLEPSQAALHELLKRAHEVGQRYKAELAEVKRTSIRRSRSLTGLDRSSTMNFNIFFDEPPSSDKVSKHRDKGNFFRSWQSRNTPSTFLNSRMVVNALHQSKAGKSEAADARRQGLLKLDDAKRTEKGASDVAASSPGDQVPQRLTSETSLVDALRAWP